MAARRTAKVRLEGEDALTPTVKKAENSWTSFGKTLLATGAIAAGAVTAALVGLNAILKRATDLAGSAETSLNKVRQSLINSGEAATTSAAEIRDWSDALEDQIGISKEQIETSFRVAQGFGATADAAQELTEAAANFGVGGELEFTEALRRLGRATQGSTEDVAKFIPAIKELSKEQLTATTIARLVNEQFGGAAQAALDGYAGRLRQIAIAQDEATEALGRAIIKQDESEGITEKQIELSRELTAQIEAGGLTLTQRFLPSLEGLENQGLRVAIALNKWFGVQKDLTDETEKGADAADEQAKAASRVALALQNEATFAEALKKEQLALAAATEKANEAFEEQIAAASVLGETTSLQLQQQIAEILEALIDQRDLLGQNSDEYVRLEAIAREKIESLRERIESLRRGQGDLTDETTALATSYDSLGVSVGRTADQFDRQAVSVRRATEAQRENDTVSGGRGSTVFTGAERTTPFTLGPGAFSQRANVVSSPNQPGTTRGSG